MAIDLGSPDEGLTTASDPSLPNSGNPKVSSKGARAYKRRSGNMPIDESLKTRLNRRRGQLDIDRMSHRPTWIDLAENFLPFRGRWLAESNDTNKGYRRNWKIINETPLIARRTLSSGMMVGITSPARPWFQLSTVDKTLMQEPGVKQWCYDLTDAMRRVFAGSNLYNTLPLIYDEISTFGTCALGVDEDPISVINTQPFTIGSYYIAQNSRRRVDTFYRDFKWTVRQIVQKFAVRTNPDGSENQLTDQAAWVNISRQVKALWDQKQYDTMIDVTHAVEPNDERVFDMKGQPVLSAAGMPYRSIYYERGGEANRTLQDSDRDNLLRKSGYREYPILVARWYTNSEDTWGRGPCSDALGSARALQLQEKRLAQAIDKLINPPMVANPSLRNQRTSILPGDVTFVAPDPSGKPAFAPVYEVRPDVTALRANIQALEQKINSLLFADVFAMFVQGDPEEGKQPITAAEVAEKKEEKLLLLGPVLWTMTDELHSPLIQRTYQIMQRRGLVPQAPEALQGQGIKVEYISILAQAQQLVASSSIERFTQFVATLGQAQAEAPGAEALDKVNFDAAIEEYGTAVSVPPSLVRTDDEVTAIRQQRAQEKAQAQQQQQMQAEGPAVAQAAGAAKSLSDTPVGNDGTSALDLLMNRGGGGGGPAPT